MINREYRVTHWDGLLDGKYVDCYQVCMVVTLSDDHHLTPEDAAYRNDDGKRILVYEAMMPCSENRSDCMAMKKDLLSAFRKSVIRIDPETKSYFHERPINRVRRGFTIDTKLEKISE